MKLWCLWKECLALRTPLFTVNIRFCVRCSMTTCFPPFVLLLTTPHKHRVSHGYFIFRLLPSLNESFRKVTFKFKFNFLRSIKATPGCKFPELLFLKSIFNENPVGLWNHLIHLSAVGSLRENNVQPHPICQRRGGLKIGRGRNGFPHLGMKCANSRMVHKGCLFWTQIMCPVFIDDTLLLTPNVFFQLRISLKEMEVRDTQAGQRLTGVFSSDWLWATTLRQRRRNQRRQRPGAHAVVGLCEL